MKSLLATLFVALLFLAPSCDPAVAEAPPVKARVTWIKGEATVGVDCESRRQWRHIRRFQRYPCDLSAVERVRNQAVAGPDPVHEPFGIESRDVRSATGADNHAKNLFIVNELILFPGIKFPFAGNLTATNASLALLDVARYENGDGSTSFSMTSGASCMLEFIAKAKKYWEFGVGAGL